MMIFNILGVVLLGGSRAGIGLRAHWSRGAARKKISDTDPLTAIR